MNKNDKLLKLCIEGTIVKILLERKDKKLFIDEESYLHSKEILDAIGNDYYESLKDDFNAYSTTKECINHIVRSLELSIYEDIRYIRLCEAMEVLFFSLNEESTEPSSFLLNEFRRIRT